MIWNIYDFTDANGESVIQGWANAIGISSRMRGRFDSKVDMLSQNGPNLSPQLLAGTKAGHIKKLKIKGDVQLRPHLCIGPIENDKEYTFLVGAVERDSKLIPEDVLDQAQVCRTNLINSNSAGQFPLRRIPHEPLRR